MDTLGWVRNVVVYALVLCVGCTLAACKVAGTPKEGIGVGLRSAAKRDYN
jgi:hypothetical protein